MGPRARGAAPTWSQQVNLWGWPTKNTLDRATATLPKLYASRMDDLGIDYSILYPSAGLFIVTSPTRSPRHGGRAYNRWVIELCASHRDRLSPVATIPMDTPDEAVHHLREAAAIGHKVVCMQGFAERPVPEVARAAPGGGRSRDAPRLLRPRQRVRLRPRLGDVRRAPAGADVPRRHGAAAGPIGDQLHLQPHRRDRPGAGGPRQGPVPRRGDPAVPGPQLRLPRVRRRMGVRAALGARRATSTSAASTA